MQRTLFKLTLGALSLGIVVAIWAATWLAYVDTIHPQSMGMTIAEFETQLGTPERIQPHVHHGNSYTIYYGKVKAIYLPSGPPVYIFDSAGKLVGWTPDVGDDENFRQKWGL